MISAHADQTSGAIQRLVSCALCAVPCLGSMSAIFFASYHRSGLRRHPTASSIRRKEASVVRNTAKLCGGQS